MTGEFLEELLNTPMTFTLDQLLSLVPIFNGRFYYVTRMTKVLEIRSVLKENVENYQIKMLILLSQLLSLSLMVVHFHMFFLMEDLE